MAEQQPILGILVSGGPAPGINGVIGAATIEAVNNGFEVIGFYDGLKWLARPDFDPEKHTTPLYISRVSRIHFDGGSILRTSRTSLADQEQLGKSIVVQPDRKKLDCILSNLKRAGVTHLITIGGDGSAVSARFIKQAAGPWLRIVHVPKTIDNDLPLPADISTFGFNTARHLGATIVANLMEDAKTSARWYLVATMGRSAGFLALGIGKAAGATLTLIPEEFPQRTTVGLIADVLEGAIIKRTASGRPDGVAVIAEGLAYKLSDKDELERLLHRKIPVDATGHPRVSEIPIANLLKDELQRRMKARNDSTTVVAHTLGYELRCAPPTTYDLGYCRDLGFGAARLLRGDMDKFPTGVMITYQGGNLVPMTFEEMTDPETNWTRVRYVDLGSDSYRVARAYMFRLERADLESPDRLAALAKSCGMTPEGFQKQFSRAVCELDDGTQKVCLLDY